MSKRSKKLPYPSDLGNFNVQGIVVYYFGEDIENAEDYTLDLPIKVKAKSEPQEKAMPRVRRSRYGSIRANGCIIILKRG